MTNLLYFNSEATLVLRYGFEMNTTFIKLKKNEQRIALSVAWKADNRNPVLQQCLNLLLN